MFQMMRKRFLIRPRACAWQTITAHPCIRLTISMDCTAARMVHRYSPVAWTFTIMYLAISGQFFSAYLFCGSLEFLKSKDLRHGKDSGHIFGMAMGTQNGM